MKVVALNGSPRKDGNTYLALKLACDVLKENGIDAEILQIGSLDNCHCRACGGCEKAGSCVFMSEEAKKYVQKIYDADGVILGSPVYYGSAAGGFRGFLDCLFYQSRGQMRHKVGASIAVCRRSGGMSTFDELNRYFTIGEMIIAPSYYWNIAHGCEKGEVLQDVEAVSTIGNLAQNIAWILKMKEQTKDTLSPPDKYKRGWLNFIR